MVPGYGGGPVAPCGSRVRDPRAKVVALVEEHGVGRARSAGLDELPDVGDVPAQLRRTATSAVTGPFGLRAFGEGRARRADRGANQGSASDTKKSRVCKHRRMMVGDLLHSPSETLIIPAAMILFFAVILIRMYAPRKPVSRKDADSQR